MATEQQVQALSAVGEAIKSVDRERLFRQDLGKHSLKNELEKQLDTIQSKVDFAVRYASEVGGDRVNQLKEVFSGIFNLLRSHAALADEQYINQKDTFLRNLQNSIEEIKKHWHVFVAAAIVDRGFLRDEDIKKEYDNAIIHMKRQADNTVETIRVETAKAIDEAKELAKQIEDRARKTAAKISVEEAQKQFREAGKSLNWKVLLWAAVSVLTVAGFVIAALKFWDHKFPVDAKWEVVYFTALRITVLTALAAVATFSMRIFRAHIHMKEHNLHRERLANSIGAFVESAATPEQRDLILTHLVDAISSFGTSGLLHKEEDTISSTKFLVDNVMRTITPPAAK